jgi:hypothetical protein
MSRLRQASNPVSLFPFLAVLVSAMGALILLLLAVTRQAQRQRLELAASKTVPEPREPMPRSPELRTFPQLPPLPPFEVMSVEPPRLPPLPEVSDRTPGLERRRRTLAQQLEAMRKDLTTPVDPSLSGDESRRQIEQRTREVDELTAKLEQWTTKIAARQREVELLEREQERWTSASSTSTASNRFAIVPYAGPGGTRRRPIFLECRKSEIVLQPERVAVPADWLRRAEHPNNPLAAMLHAILQKLQLETGEEPPYPLLLVRPDGVAGYYVAQKAIDHLNVAMGYELVDASVELAYPAPDPEIRRVAEEALKRAIEGGPNFLADGSGAWSGRANSIAGETAESVGGPGNLARFASLFDPTPTVASADGPTSDFHLRPVPRTVGELATGPPTRPGSTVALPSRDASATAATTLENADRPAATPSLRPPTGGSAGDEMHEPVSFQDLLTQPASGSPGDKTSPHATRNGFPSGDPGGDDSLPMLNVPLTLPGAQQQAIDIVCRGDGLVFYPNLAFVPLAGDIEVRPAVDKLLETVRHRVSAWMTEKNGRNRTPVLVFHVQPDGLRNYYRVRFALLGVNLPIEHRIAEEARASAQPR